MSEYEVIPQQAIDSLLANPEKSGGFDTVFGQGRAAEILAANQAAPAEEAAEDDDDWSLMGEAYRAILGGVRDAAQETGNFAKYLGDSVADAVWGEGNDVFWTDNGLEVLPRSEAAKREDLGWFQRSLAENGQILGDGGYIDLPEVEQNRTLVGGMARGFTQFAAGYFMFSKMHRLQGLKGAFVSGALADAIVFNPEDPNVTKMLEEWGVDVPILTEVLATDPDDPEWMNRLRNAGEGAIIGGLVEAIGWSVKAVRARKMGRTDEAVGFDAKVQESLAGLDEAIRETGREMAEETRAALDLSKKVTSEIAPKVDAEVRGETRLDVADVDGQLSLDLGDVPAPRQAPVNGKPVEGRIWLTPEKVEKIRLQTSLADGVPKVGKQSMFSWRSPSTFESVEDVIEEMAGQKAVKADDYLKLKGGDVQRWNTVMAQSVAKARSLAKMYGEDPEEFIRTMLKANLGDISKMAAEVHAREQIALGAQQEVRMLGKALGDFLAGKPVDFRKLPGITNVDDLRLAFEKAVTVATNATAGTDALRSNMARAFNATKIAKKGDKSMREMLRNPEYFKNTDAMARAIADPKNADKPAVQVINSTLGILEDVGNRINSFRINALLSGPGTQEVNAISNAIQMFYIPAQQAIGGIATGNPRMVAHALRQLQGSVAGFIDAAGTAAKAGWEGDSILDAFSNKVEGNLEDFGKITGLKPVDNTLTLPSRLLMTMDEFFKQAQYRGRVFADANQLAKDKGLKGTDRSDFIKEYLKDSYTQPEPIKDAYGNIKLDGNGDPMMTKGGAATRGEALLQARRATFTEPLEPGFTSMVQAMAIKSPIVRFFVPFIRTPVNILSQTFQHAPVLGMTSKRWRADIAAGGPRAAQAWGKQVVGTGLALGAATLAAQGHITGSGPSDPRIRKVWLKNNQPYSFKIVNEDGSVTWISYARLEPLSNVFSIAADAWEISNDEYNEAEKFHPAQALLMAVMENTVNKTFTQGIYDAMSLFVGRPHEQEAAVKNFVASFVPNVLNQTNGDEALREARSITDAVLARTHLYNGVDPKRNVLGEPILRTLPKYDPLGLTQRDTREIDPVLEEITRVAILNQTVADNPGKRLAGPNRIDLTQVPYRDGQSLYDRWLELTGTVEINGMTLREKLQSVSESDAYKRAPDGYIGATSNTKGAVIRSIIESYRKKARAELPELLELERQEKRGGAVILRSQRGLFAPLPATEQPFRRRTFEDLLKQ